MPVSFRIIPGRKDFSSVGFPFLSSSLEDGARRCDPLVLAGSAKTALPLEKLTDLLPPVLPWGELSAREPPPEATLLKRPPL